MSCARRARGLLRPPLRCRAHFLHALDPNRRRRGIGAALYERLAPALTDAGAHTVVAKTTDDEGVAFAERRGFRVGRTQLVSRRDLTAPLPPVPTPPEGLTVVPLRDADPDARYAMESLAAAAAGATEAYTDNDAANTGMLAVNERLGYEAYATNRVLVWKAG